MKPFSYDNLFYKNILDHMIEGCQIIGFDWRYLYLNDAVQIQSRRPNDELLGNLFTDMWPGIENTEIYEVIRHCMEEREPRTLENKFVFPDGSEGWFELHMTPVPEGVFIMSLDITERKMIEVALRESDNRLKKVLETIPLGVWISDKEGKIIYGNSTGQDIWQGVRYVKPDKFHEYKAWWKSTGKPITPDEWGITRAIQGKKESHEEEIEIECFDGTRKTILNWAVPIIGENGNVEGAIAINQDISDREKAKIEKERLIQLQLHSQKIEAVGTLAGGIAHDFNNMLGLVMGNITFALSMINSNNELYQALSDAQEGAQKAQTLTQQLLTFAKGGAPIKTSINLNQLIRESAEFVTRGSKSRCLFDLTPNTWPVMADPGQLNQVISNLVINADQAMPDGGTIEIKSEHVELKEPCPEGLIEGHYIKITIKDHGEGIPEENLPNIFDPYFSTKPTGTGMGLATTYSITRRHDGLITVESTPGWGTTFCIFLPVTLRQQDQAAENKTTLPKSRGSVLIMDDQPAILTMVSRMLNRMGFETASAMDGSQAVAMYKESLQSNTPFDLVILDLTIPGGMGGAKAMEKLKAIDPQVKAIVSSGYSNDPIMAEYQTYGFHAVIPKPYTKQQLEDVMNELFEREAITGKSSKTQCQQDSLKT